MPSQIDPTKPEDNVQVDKSELREQFATAQAEITALQRQSTLAWRIAMGAVDL